MVSIHDEEEAVDGGSPCCSSGPEHASKRIAACVCSQASYSEDQLAGK